jgi:serine/threonine-protein kinase
MGKDLGDEGTGARAGAETGSDWPSRVRRVGRATGAGGAGSYRIIGDSAPPERGPDRASVAPRANDGPPAPSAHAYYRPRPGAVLAERYRLLEPICEGGMGRVWRARDEERDADVAVKLLREGTRLPHGANRLFDEAAAVARLRHPSIVEVLDLGEAPGGDPFLVMELVVGPSLAEVLARRGVLPPNAAVRTLLPVASALSMAHARGVVHRDVKPDHVLLAESGDGRRTPKLVDFGVARIRSPRGRHLSVDGNIVGSPAYMAPEQAHGARPIDGRADEWGLAMTLYELLHGSPAYGGATTLALLSATLADAPVPRPSFADREPELWDVMARALAKDPDARYPTLRAFGGALAEWAGARGIEVDIAGGSLRATWLATR